MVMWRGACPGAQIDCRMKHLTIVDCCAEPQPRGTIDKPGYMGMVPRLNFIRLARIYAEQRSADCGGS
jgi:hypothetical protein